MSKPTVVNLKHDPYDVYIGRANGSLPQSKWANPWVIGRDGTREEVIARYEAWIKTRPELMAALPELRGKVLGCWCSPQHCHGDVLAQLVGELPAIEPPVRGHTANIIHVDEAMLIPPSNILPVFSTHYGFDSILTLEEAGKTEPGNPVSICDIAKKHGLKQVVLVDFRIDGFIEAYKNIQKAGLSQLIYGLKLAVVPDMADKTPLRAESNVIIFPKNTQAYNDVIRIWNRAWTDGFHTPPRESGYGRIDWKTLKDLWTPNLSLALPFFSSFLARNTLTFASIVPDLPVPPDQITLFKEMESGLPFADLLDQAVDRFAVDSGAQVQPTKSIYYEDGERDFATYMVYRAMHQHGTFSAPNVDNLASNRFSWTDYVRLTKQTT